MFELIWNMLQNFLFIAGYVGGGTAFPKQLSPEEEQMYLGRYQAGDTEAKNILIEHNLRLVAHIAKKYSNESNADDLISIGIIGLIKGINTFNPEKNPRLATYIARCIENEVLMVLRANRKLNSEISLDECIGTDKEGNSMTFSDILAADLPDVADEISTKMDIQKLYQAMEKRLGENEINILNWRYGLHNTEKKTQKEIADILGISRSYVSRIEKRALNKLRQEFEDEEN